MSINPETGEILEEDTPQGKAEIALMGFTLAKLTLESYEQVHEAILRNYHHYQRVVEETEAELKAAMRELGQGIENESFTVSVVTPYAKWYDAEIILKEFPQVKALPGVVVETVDKKKIEMLAKGGMIPQDIVDRAYCEEPETPRVTIKVKTA